MREQVEADWPLDDGVDQSADDRQQRQGGYPFRLLEPHRADGRGVLDPAKAGFHRRVLLLIRVENLCISTGFRTHGRRQDRPPVVLRRVDEGLTLDFEAIT